MPELDQPLIVFTDVEGTLLDSHTQLWEPARDWLLRLKQHNVPVVLCSSKTAVEMMLLQKELELGPQPLIAENGAVIQLAEEWQDEEEYPRLITGFSS